VDEKEEIQYGKTLKKRKEGDIHQTQTRIGSCGVSLSFNEEYSAGEQI